MNRDPDFAQACAAQLRRVLQSDAFRRTKQAQQFLAFVGQEYLCDRADKLTQTVIAVEGFTNDITEDKVRKLAVDVRARLASYYAYGAPGFTDPFVIVMPLGGYRLKFEPNPNSLRAAS